MIRAVNLAGVACSGVGSKAKGARSAVVATDDQR